MENLISQINDLYALQLPAIHEKVTRGFLSENHVLGGENDKYFLKCYRAEDAARVDQIHAAEFFFAEAGIPAVLPLKAKDGATSFHYEDKVYALFPFVAGRVIERCGLTPEAFRSMGKMLAKLHQRGAEPHPSAPVKNEAWNKEKYLAEANQILDYIAHKVEKDDFDRQVETFLRQKVAFVMENTKTYAEFSFTSDHLVHGDFQEGNLFFDAHDQVTHILDWDNVRIVPRMFELLRAVSVMCFNGQYAEANFGKAQHLLQAYHAEYPVVADELARALDVYYIKSFHSLWLEREYYLQHNSRVTYYFPSEVSRHDYLKAHYQTYAERLLGFVKEVSS